MIGVVQYLGFSIFLLFLLVYMEGGSSISWSEEEGRKVVKEQSRITGEMKRQETRRVDAGESKREHKV